jgi:hypothetical protein
MASRPSEEEAYCIPQEKARSQIYSSTLGVAFTARPHRFPPRYLQNLLEFLYHASLFYGNSKGKD